MEKNSTADVLLRPHADLEPAARLTILGTGTSVGVPVVGCRCHVCTSENPRNQRLRSGVLVQAPQGEFVIDTGPELRLQLLRANASLIQAAIFTHAHADHILGLDDLRIFSFRVEQAALEAARTRAAECGEPFQEDAFLKQSVSGLPLFCEAEVETSLRQVFSYAFCETARKVHRFATPRLRFVRIVPGIPFELLGLTILPIRLKHGELPVLGFRIGNVAFCTDVSTIPAGSRDLLQGLDVLILDALRYEPHPTHLSVDGALKVIRQLRPARTFLTHMSHDLDYDQLCEQLPDDVRPAWDGLQICLGAAGTATGIS